MATTRADVAVLANTWTDLYAASGIAVGTAVSVTNKGSFSCQIAISTSAPVSTSIGYPLFAGAEGSTVAVDAGETGLWAYCNGGSTKLLVQE